VRVVRLLTTTLVLACLVVLGGSTTAHACTCDMRSPAEERADVDLIFTGTLTSVVGLGSTTNVAYQRFAVDQVYKGVAAREVELKTSSQAGACAPGFAEERRYLVYAYRYRGALTTGSCANNVADPAETMLVHRFGDGRPPDAGLPLPPAHPADLSVAIAFGHGYRGLMAIGVVGVGLVAVALAAVALVLARRRAPLVPG
jgi:hypothetical protein